MSHVVLNLFALINTTDTNSNSTSNETLTVPLDSDYQPANSNLKILLTSPSSWSAVAESNHTQELMLCFANISLTFCTASVLELFQMAGVSDFLRRIKRRFIGAAPEK
jgi:hypothetical protein